MSAHCTKCGAEVYQDENGFYCPICRYEKKIDKLKEENEKLRHFIRGCVDPLWQEATHFENKLSVNARRLLEEIASNYK